MDHYVKQRRLRNRKCRTYCKPPEDYQARAIGNMNKNISFSFWVMKAHKTDKLQADIRLNRVSTYSSRCLWRYSVISLKSSVIIRPTTLSITKLDNPLAGRTCPEQWTIQASQLDAGQATYGSRLAVHPVWFTLQHKFFQPTELSNTELQSPTTALLTAVNFGWPALAKHFLFHHRTRASYVYNGCLAWYNVVLTPRIHSSIEIQVQICRSTAGDSCDSGTGVLHNCLAWYKFVNTHLYHSRQLYKIHKSSVGRAKWVTWSLQISIIVRIWTLGLAM